MTDEAWEWILCRCLWHVFEPLPDPWPRGLWDWLLSAYPEGE